MSRLCYLFTLSFVVFLNPSLAVDFEGQLSIENRYFFEEGDFAQSRNDFSIAFEPELYHEWDDGDFSVVFKPFYRWDSMDDERSHGDIRELLFTYVGEEWEIKAGLGKVFWGVAESQHLVDIINQTDFVENIDGEDKLGQPMVAFSSEREWGLIQLFVLPGFRERTFAGNEGRLRFPLAVDTDNPIYADTDEDNRIDAAVRWSHTLGDWDVGLAHFSGTSREPLFVLDNTRVNDLRLRPMYVTIDQTSIDVQATKGAWLWKLEAISRSGYSSNRYWAAVGGFEYTFYGINESDIDVGIIMEYQTDSRDVLPGGFEQKDVLVTGMRFAFNDEQSTDALLGMSFGEGQQFINLEASRRLGDSWKLILEARLFSGIDDNQPNESIFYPFRNDSYFSLALEKYF